MATLEGDQLDPIAARWAAELAQAQDRNRQLDAALFALAEPAARMVMIAVDRWCDLAEDPRNPQQLAARKLLQGWFRTMDRGRRVAAGIALAKDGDGQARGPG